LPREKLERVVRLVMAKQRRLAMIAALHFITLVVTTMLAAAAAVFVNWVLLRGAFLLMRPAAAGRAANQTAQGVSGAAGGIHLVSGTVQVARAYAGRR
jgi:hypothetical protein